MGIRREATQGTSHPQYSQVHGCAWGSVEEIHVIL